MAVIKNTAFKNENQKENYFNIFDYKIDWKLPWAKRYCEVFGSSLIYILTV